MFKRKDEKMEIDLTGKDLSIGSRLNININGYAVPTFLAEDGHSE